MPVAKASSIIPTNGWSSTQKQLWLQARRQVKSAMTQNSSFDAEGNWVGDERPNDIVNYWANLSETDRAFERLQRTDAAVYMEFVDLIRRTMPPGVELTELDPIVVEPK